MPVLPQLPMWRKRTIPSGITIGWPSTVGTIPSGWTRETALDGVFVKQIATSGTNPGATGGATTHTHPFSAHSSHTFTGHTHSGSWGNSPTTNGGSPKASLAQNVVPTTHNHPSSGAVSATVAVTNNSTPTNTDATNTDPSHVTQVFITSNGTTYGIPVSGLVWFNGASPSGFSVYGNLDNRLWKGAAGGADGGTQAGSDSHTHTTATHTHPITDHTHVASLDSVSTTVSIPSGSSANDELGTHGHTLGTSTANSGQTTTDATSETTGTGDLAPPWQKMRAVQKTTSAGIASGVIAIWTGTLAAIPFGWLLCDGTNGTPNLCQGKYVRGAASDGEVGNTGGAATHTHAAGTAHSHTTTGTHTHTFTGSSGSTSPISLDASSSGGANNMLAGHSHTSTTYTSPTQTTGTSSTQATTQNANSSNDPSFYGVAYLQYAA